MAKQFTPEELHKIRSEAAKKAAETVRKREQLDPLYAAQRKVQRLANIKHTTQQMVDALNELRLEQQKAASFKKEPRKIDINPTKKPSTSIPQKEEKIPPTPSDRIGNSESVTDIPEETATIIDNLRTMISGAQNKSLSNLIEQVLDDEINTIGEEELGKRLSKSSAMAIDLAYGAMYESRTKDNDTTGRSAYGLISLITGGNIPAYLLEEIENASEEDRRDYIAYNFYKYGVSRKNGKQ